MFKDKKIMVVATTDNMIWQFLIPHIKFLQEKGNEVECVCAKTGFWFDELKEKYGFKVHEINFARSPISPKNLKGYKELKKLQKREKYDLIYCQQPVGGLMGRLIAKKFKLPCIYTAHGFHFFKGNNPIKNFIFKTIEKYLAKFTTALITINNEDFNACKKWKAKGKYIINGIGYDPKKYSENRKREDIRKSLGLTNEFTILTVAEIIKRKNYETMVRAIAELKDVNLKFLICGRGRDKEKIDELISTLQINEKVDFLGFRKDINDVMIASDMFLLPSYQEGLTLSIIEALHFGLPVVTSSARGNRDLIEDGLGGFVCDPDDHITISKKILQLMKDEELRKNMGMHNLSISSDYDIEVVQKQLEEIYNEINND